MKLSKWVAAVFVGTTMLGCLGAFAHGLCRAIQTQNYASLVAVGVMFWLAGFFAALASLAEGP